MTLAIPTDRVRPAPVTLRKPNGFTYAYGQGLSDAVALGAQMSAAIAASAAGDTLEFGPFSATISNLQPKQNQTWVFHGTRLLHDAAADTTAIILINDTTGVTITGALYLNGNALLTALVGLKTSGQSDNLTLRGITAENFTGFSFDFGSLQNAVTRTNMTMKGCRAAGSTYGAYYRPLCEYNLTDGCNFDKNGIGGVVIGGGNNRFANCSANNNTQWGIILDSGTNDSHGVWTGGTANHNGTGSVDYAGTFGFDFIGLQCWTDNKISYRLKTGCLGLRVTGGTHQGAVTAQGTLAEVCQFIGIHMRSPGGIIPNFTAAQRQKILFRDCFSGPAPWFQNDYSDEVARRHPNCVAAFMTTRGQFTSMATTVAGDTLVETNGTQVGLWRESIGYAIYPSESTGGNKPTLDLYSFGGQPSLRLTKASSQRLIWNGLPFTDQAGMYTVGVKIVSISGTSAIFATGVNAGALQHALYLDGSGFLNLQYSASKSVRADTIGALVAGRSYFISVYSDGAAVGIRVNGVDQSLTTAGGANDGTWFGDQGTTDRMAFGCTSAGGVINNFLDGYLNYFAYVSGTPNAAVMEGMEVEAATRCNSDYVLAPRAMPLNVQTLLRTNITAQFLALTDDTAAIEMRNTLGATGGVWDAGMGGTGISSLGTNLPTAMGVNLNTPGGLISLTGAQVGGTVVVSTPLLAMTQTWNAGAQTFRGMDLAITNTASAAASTALRILGGAGGATQIFAVTIAGVVQAGTFGDASGNAFTSASGAMRISLGYMWLGGSDDCRINRAAAGVLAVESSSSTAAGGTLRFARNTQAQFTANQNNLAMTTPSYFQRWSSDAARDVTGIVAGGDGQEHVLINVGAQNIVLKHQVTSTAANQFFCSTGADITLAANQAADIIYDGAISRWLVFKRN